MDNQNDNSTMLSVVVQLLDGTTMTLQVGMLWSLANLREEISFYQSEDLGYEWTFRVLTPTAKVASKKVCIKFY